MKQNVLKSFVFFGLLVLLATPAKIVMQRRKLRNWRAASQSSKVKNHLTQRQLRPHPLRLRQKQNLKVHFQPWNLQTIDHDFGTINEGEMWSIPIHLKIPVKRP